MTEKAILVADVGGTNVRFAPAWAEGASLRLGEVWKQPGDLFANFDAALAAFIDASDQTFEGAAIGAAGAVRDGRVDLGNRNWSIDVRDVARRVGVDPGKVVMVNDFMTMARSAPALSAEQAQLIAPGAADPEGSICVGGPGTGFGVGVLRRLSGAEGYVVIGGEGGHQHFTPLSEIEWRLVDVLRGQGVYVSNEEVAAGVGFHRTLGALAQVLGRVLPSLPAEEGAQQAEVLRLAQAGDELALAFCRLRARTILSALGDVALLANTTGGVFVAGGVAARLAPWLSEPAALDCFYKRGPRTMMLKPVPIRLIVSEAAPLIGAALMWTDKRTRGWL